MLAQMRDFLKSLVFGLALACVGQMRADVGVQVAPPAPSFTAKDLTGRDVKLSQFAGKPLIVVFWLSSDTPSREQISILAELHKQYADDGLAVVGMALDPEGPGVVKTFVEKTELKFPVIMADYKLTQDFRGITAVPTSFVIDQNQNIISKHVGVTKKEPLETCLKALFKK